MNYSIVFYYIALIIAQKYMLFHISVMNNIIISHKRFKLQLYCNTLKSPMGSKTRLSSYCSKRGDNTVNLVTSRKVNTRLARPIVSRIFPYHFLFNKKCWQDNCIYKRLLVSVQANFLKSLKFNIVDILNHEDGFCI